MPRTVRQLFELFLLPGLAVVLPWSWCFRMFRAAARLPLYRAPSCAALAGARRLQPIDDPDRWLREHRLIRLCDHADLFLSRTRGDRWMARHLRVSGEWPGASEPFLAVTFHWGTGLWSLRHLRSRGVKGAFLSIRLDRASFAGDALAHAYARMRLSELSRVSGADVIYTRGAAAAMRAAWRRGDSVVALYDVPPHQARGSVDARVLGHSMRLPMGLARLACEERIPVVAFSMGIDPADGSRLLEISPAWRGEREADLVNHLAGEFERLLRRNLAAWQLCANVAEFFPHLTSEAASP